MQAFGEELGVNRASHRRLTSAEITLSHDEEDPSAKWTLVVRPEEAPRCARGLRCGVSWAGFKRQSGCGEAFAYRRGSSGTSRIDHRAGPGWSAASPCHSRTRCGPRLGV